MSTAAPAVQYSTPETAESQVFSLTVCFTSTVTILAHIFYVTHDDQTLDNFNMTLNTNEALLGFNSKFQNLHSNIKRVK